MKLLASHLMPHEYQGLIDALKRDLRREEEKLEQEPDWSYYHYTNIRCPATIRNSGGDN